MKIRSIASILTLAFVALPACEESVTGPSVQQVAGTYELTQLIVRQAGSQNDLISEGVTATITLNADGTTSGSLFIPDTVNLDGVEINEDLAGTWSLEGREVEFEHDAPESFIKDVVWTYQDETGNLTVGDAQNWIESTLTAQ